MDTTPSDPIPAFIRRVEQVEQQTALSREEAEAVVSAGLSDDEIAGVVHLLMTVDQLSIDQAIKLVHRPLYHYGRLGPRPTPQKRPAYAAQLLQNFGGISRKRSRPAPRKRARG